MTKANFSLTDRSVYVAGHGGMVGSALVRRLASEHCTVLTADRSTDLRNQAAVDGWFAAHRPDTVVIAAARVGGIAANDASPAEFLYDNLMIEANLIEASRRNSVEKLLFLGSSCIYPKLADQPISEEALLTGPLEPTNEWYAIAKIAGVKLCQAYRRQYGCDYISAMPTNLYGPGDNFDLATSHVIPAMIRKVHEAKAAGASSFEIWGSGTPRRESLHVDDIADACIFLLKSYSGDVGINVGSGEERTILQLAELVAKIVGFKGGITLDATKPDGTPRKLIDSSKLTAMGWSAKIGLEAGLAATYQHYLERVLPRSPEAALGGASIA